MKTLLRSAAPQLCQSAGSHGGSGAHLCLTTALRSAYRRVAFYYIADYACRCQRPDDYSIGNIVFLLQIAFLTLDVVGEI